MPTASYCENKSILTGITSDVSCFGRWKKEVEISGVRKRVAARRVVLGRRRRVEEMNLGRAVMLWRGLDLFASFFFFFFVLIGSDRVLGSRVDWNGGGTLPWSELRIRYVGILL